MTQRVHIRAPSRLHFGMFGFGQSDGPQWGGVGVMVDRPAIEVTIEPATGFSATGNLEVRTEQFVERVVRVWQLPALPACQIHVDAPPEHTGLGVGTQLGLSIAAALRHSLQLSDLSPQDLAASVGRGKRSAVGTHGFRLGGFIVDAGKSGDESLGKLQERVSIPEDWRFVLIASQDQPGLAGDTEADAFARLPPVPGEVTEGLWRIANDEMLPALQQGDCDSFGEAVYHFGRLAGECFAAAQGGPFASEKIGRLVDAIRDRGVNGVGQSSWGPTVFAITADDNQAAELAQWLRAELKVDSCELTIAGPDNRGAVIM